MSQQGVERADRPVPGCEPAQVPGRAERRGHRETVDEPDVTAGEGPLAAVAEPVAQPVVAGGPEHAQLGFAQVGAGPVSPVCTQQAVQSVTTAWVGTTRAIAWARSVTESRACATTYTPRTRRRTSDHFSKVRRRWRVTPACSAVRTVNGRSRGSAARGVEQGNGGGSHPSRVVKPADPRRPSSTGNQKRRVSGGSGQPQAPGQRGTGNHKRRVSRGRGRRRRRRSWRRGRRSRRPSGAAPRRSPPGQAVASAPRAGGARARRGARPATSAVSVTIERLRRSRPSRVQIPPQA